MDFRVYGKMSLVGWYHLNPLFSFNFVQKYPDDGDLTLQQCDQIW